MGRLVAVASDSPKIHVFIVNLFEEEKKELSMR